MARKAKVMKNVPLPKTTQSSDTDKVSEVVSDIVTKLQNAGIDVNVVNIPKANPVTGPMPMVDEEDDIEIRSTISPLEFFEQVGETDKYSTMVACNGIFRPLVTHTDAQIAAFNDGMRSGMQVDAMKHINSAYYDKSINSEVADLAVESLIRNAQELITNRVNNVVSFSYDYICRLLAGDIVQVIEEIVEKKNGKYTFDKLAIVSWVYSYLRNGTCDLGDGSYSATPTPFNGLVGNSRTQLFGAVDTLVELAKKGGSIEDRDIATMTMLKQADYTTSDMEQLLIGRVNNMLIFGTPLSNLINGVISQYAFGMMVKEMMCAIHIPLLNGILKHQLPIMVTVAADDLHETISYLEKDVIKHYYNGRYYN